MTGTAGAAEITCTGAVARPEAGAGQSLSSPPPPSPYAGRSTAIRYITAWKVGEACYANNLRAIEAHFANSRLLGEDPAPLMVAKINATGRHQCPSPLEAAAMGGHIELVMMFEHLLDYSGAVQCILAAAERGNTDAATDLIELLIHDESHPVVQGLVAIELAVHGWPEELAQWVKLYGIPRSMLPTAGGPVYLPVGTLIGQCQAQSKKYRSLLIANSADYAVVEYCSARTSGIEQTISWMLEMKAAQEAAQAAAASR